MAAAMSAVRSSIRRSVIASTSIPSIPSVPLIKASPSLARSSHRRQAGGSEGVGGRHQRPGGVTYVALPHQRQRAVGERSEVSGATQRAVLADHGRDPRGQQRRQQLRGLPPDAGVTGGQRREPQQHQAPHDLALHLGPGARGVRADQRALELLAQLARDVAGREGAESRRDPVRRCGRGRELLDHRPSAVDGGERVLGQRDRGPAPGHRDHVVERHRTHAHLHHLHVAIQLPGRSLAPPSQRRGCLGSETDRAADPSPLRGVVRRPRRSTVIRSRAVRAHGGSSPCRPG